MKLFIYITYFQEIKECGRSINLDLHAKGIDDKLIKSSKTFQLESLNISNLVHIKVVKILFQDGLKKISQDYKNSLSLDNANDFSMGYIEAFGYRASTCSSFFFYDLSNETKTNLLVTPLSLIHISEPTRQY